MSRRRAAQRAVILADGVAGCGRKEEDVSEHEDGVETNSDSNRERA